MVLIKIYTLTNPINGGIFYAGRCVGNICTRLAGHINDVATGQTSQKTKIIQEILSNGLKPIIEEIESFECNGKADEIFINNMENYWIEQLKSWGFNMVNVTGLTRDYNNKPIIHWYKKDTEKNKIQEKLHCIEWHIEWILQEAMPNYVTTWFGKKVFNNERNKQLKVLYNELELWKEKKRNHKELLFP